MRTGYFFLKSTKTFETICNALQLGLLIAFSLSQFLHLNIGLADNSDYIRSFIWFVRAPVGFETSFSDIHAEDFFDRYFSFWLPYWQIHPARGEHFSSSLFIWLPGFLINYFLFSKDILMLPILSLFPRIFLGISIFLVFSLLNHFLTGYKRLIATISIGIPLTLVYSTTDYVSYLNSFYQEVGTIVYSLMFFIGMVWIRYSRSRLSFKLLFVILLSFLFSSTKAQYFYWMFLVLPFVFQKNNRFYNLTLILVSIIFTAVILILSNPQSLVNKYHSIFYGSLTFSKNPELILQRLGYHDAVDCVNFHLSTIEGRHCFHKYFEVISWVNVLKIYWEEPLILFRQFLFAAENFQRIELEYLSKLPKGLEGFEYRWNLLNLWSIFKNKAFPKGGWLLITFGLMILTFQRYIKRLGLYRYISTFGLLVTAGCLVDMNVVVIGDGRYEINKHLLLSNLCFDYALISWFGLLSLIIVEALQERFSINAPDYEKR